MRNFRQYKFLKVYLDEQIFETIPEFKVGYLNINGLTDGYHGELLNTDYNLLNLNILALAETHLTNSESSNQIKHILDRWTMLYRMDAED